MKESNVKNLLAHIFMKNGKAVTGLTNFQILGKRSIPELAKYYEHKGADALILFDLAESEEEHRLHQRIIKCLCSRSQIPILAGGHIDDIRDMEELMNMGCDKVFLNMSREENREILHQAQKQFGKEHIAVCINDFTFPEEENAKMEKYADEVSLLGDNRRLYEAVRSLPVNGIPLMDIIDYQRVYVLLKEENVSGISGNVISNTEVDLFELKDLLQMKGLNMRQQKSAIAWSEFKLNSDGLIPVIVQDYRNNEVLMLAYMNEEAFDKTVKTGRMTYWSRSRQELWIKGETSGHFQYVKRLSIDCDNDTLLAYVVQIGAACHTGNRSCFYRDLVKKEYDEIDPMDTLHHLYEKAKDRKEGLIDHQSVKKQAADVLYHMTDLMAEYRVSWEDVTEEINRRERKLKEK